MNKFQAVPDAWEDDDWEAQADRVAAEPAPAPKPEAPLTKTERLARHAETNRKLWESAETPEPFHYLAARSNAPAVTTDFKPQVKVLSRKPVIAKRSNVTDGMGNLSLGYDDDDEDAATKKTPLSPEEIRAKQKRDLEEKQRRYDEARAKIFGESAPSSGQSSPGNVTPPRGAEGGYASPRGRGRGRGGRGNGNSYNHGETRQQQQQQQQQHNLDARRQPFQPSSAKGLYDPNYTQKPTDLTGAPRRPDEGPPRVATPRDEQQPIRIPRGPDGSGRGGFGFARGRGRGG